MKKKIINYKIRIIEYIYLKIINKLKYLLSFKYNDSFKKYRNEKKIVLTLLPSHGNLGDHAIAYASYEFLKNNFQDYKIIQLDMSEIYKYGKSVKCILKKDDFIVMIGGGNMNNLYKNEEWTRRFIIKKFNSTSIISLPQTIAFTSDKKGLKELKKTKKIYNKNNLLTVFARENKSFNIMKNTFEKNKVIENPDMVFYMENMECDYEYDRENILVCLRNDLEGFINVENKKKIINNLKLDYENVIVSDTVINKNINIETRGVELKSIWNEFFKSKVVITDRLHGMIFSVITKTPCIVIRNSDHKIIESYKWIRNLNYIKLIEDTDYDNIKKHIEELLNLEKVDSLNFRNEYFINLADTIRSIVENNN